MVLVLEGLCKSFGSREVLKDVSLSVAGRECVSVIGPSGAGKTTLLKIVAGMERPDAGSVRFSREPGSGHPVILVFQDYLLFPALTVFENVAFGLRARRLARAELHRKVEGLLEAFGLSSQARSYPARLSAGQKQRVAIARALAVEPGLLLLDEPFAHLDRNLKGETAAFLRETQRRFGVAMISVTHDLEEAFAMSDRVGLLLDGRLVQTATPAELYARPVSAEAARFLGPLNHIGRDLSAVLGRNGDAFFVRPEALELVPDSQGPGLVTEVVFAGHHLRYLVDVGGERLTVFGPLDGVRAGERVRLRLIGPLVAEEEWT